MASPSAPRSRIFIPETATYRPASFSTMSLSSSVSPPQSSMSGSPTSSQSTVYGAQEAEAANLGDKSKLNPASAVWTPSSWNTASMTGQVIIPEPFNALQLANSLTQKNATMNHVETTSANRSLAFDLISHALSQSNITGNGSP